MALSPRPEEPEQKNSYEQLFDVFAKITPAAIFMHQGKNYVYINSFASTLTGYSAKEICELHFSDIVSPKYREMVKQRGLARLKGKAVPNRYDFPIIRKDGKQRWVDLSVSITEYNGKPSVFGVAFDITELKKTQQELAEEMNKYQSLAESARDFIFLVDNNMVIEYVNKYANKHFHKKEKLTGKKISDVFPKHTHERQMQNLKAVFKTGKSARVTGKFVFKNTDYWLDTSLVPLKDATNKVYSVMGISRDITEKKEAELATKKSEKLYRSLVETSPDAIILTDLNMKIQMYNQQTAALFKIKDTSEALGKLSLDYISRADIKRAKKDIKKTLLSGKARRVEYSLVKEDGSHFIGLVNVTVIYDEQAKPLSILAIVEDVTQRKKAEESLAKAHQISVNISHTLQQSLLPQHLPSIKGLNIKTYYRSASRGAEVGGDFFDIFELPGNNYGIVMGDVSGKGIEAATETAKIKYLLRDRAYGKTMPSDVLTNVNNALFKQKTVRFTALTYAIFLTKESKLLISNAGNPYPYCVTEDRFLELTGVPVSIKPKQKYETTELELKDSDTLLMYTDGLTEARIDSKLYGEQRVCQFVKKNKHLALNMLLKKLVEEASAFSKNKLTDDILLIGIKKKAS
ncbi:MAG: PAS domain S-box protein [Actinobacteria bacterium]|nr:MAG: PAS domain S-box protein [Actinomycetota bacterium]